MNAHVITGLNPSPGSSCAWLKIKKAWNFSLHAAVENSCLVTPIVTAPSTALPAAAGARFAWPGFIYRQTASVER